MRVSVVGDPGADGDPGFRTSRSPSGASIVVPESAPPRKVDDSTCNESPAPGTRRVYIVAKFTLLPTTSVSGDAGQPMSAVNVVRANCFGDTSVHVWP